MSQPMQPMQQQGGMMQQQGGMMQPQGGMMQPQGGMGMMQRPMQPQMGMMQPQGGMSMMQPQGVCNPFARQPAPGTYGAQMMGGQQQQSAQLLQPGQTMYQPQAPQQPGGFGSLLMDAKKKAGVN